MKKKVLWMMILALSIALLNVSCSRAPSKSVIKSAITKCLKDGVPYSLTGLNPVFTSQVAQNTRIELIEIKQIGKFNDFERYWPVKARVKGTCEYREMFVGGTKTVAFDGIEDFWICQDDYGNWEAGMAW